MKKSLNLAFIIMICFWNINFFISILPQNSLGKSSNKGISEEDNRYIELNITEENIPEILWQPIENSLEYNFSKERSTIITNGTSIVEYDLIRKIETITHRRDIEIIGTYKNSSINGRMKGIPLSVVGEIKPLK